MKKFSISEAIKFGWEVFKKKPWFLIGVILVIFFINSIPNTITEQLRSDDYSLILALIGLAFWILNMLVSLGGIKISLALTDGKKAEFADLFNGYSLLINFILASILYALIVVFGMVLLIVPGIIFAIMFHFYSYLIVDKNMSPVDALKESKKLTSGSKWQLFLFGLVLLLLNVAGVLALLVGLLITVPVTMIAYAYVFRKLQGTTPTVAV